MTENHWMRTWWIALAVLLAGVIAWESMFAALGGGNQPVVDDVQLWAEWRDRAAASRDGDLVLVGASRMQLDIDIATLESVAGGRVFQLAIDGTSFLPVLYDLALDARVRGDVVVSVRAPDLTGHGIERAQEFVRYYRQWEAAAFLSPSEYTERLLEENVLVRFPSRAQGVRPESLYALWRDGRQIADYLSTFPSREREADYSRIDVARLRAARLARSIDWHRNSAEVDRAEVAQTIAGIRQAVQMLRARGSSVFFVRLPVSEELLRANERYLPDAEYLGRLERETGVELVDFADYPQLRRFELPDGSHLDRRDQVAFTRELAEIIEARRNAM